MKIVIIQPVTTTDVTITEMLISIEALLLHWGFFNDQSMFFGRRRISSREHRGQK